jgi:xylulokinase
VANIIAYDLGTGGIKASLHNEDGERIATSFIAYDTCYPQSKWHEQRPADWWNGVCESTRMLLHKSKINADEIIALALSGHSLVAVPISAEGAPLLERVPIWSDTRAATEAQEFFRQVPYEHWYRLTGNGDPAECYTVMKLLWMKKHQPEVFNNTRAVLGSKDFINFMLTGRLRSDPSYASGTGLFNLEMWCYDEALIAASGLPRAIFPPLIPSDGAVGAVTKEAAAATGLREGTIVACGGVDNACMALGARGIGEGRVYTSLGSSCWIAVTSQKPVIDLETRPFVFAHVEKGYYTSGMSIFSGGNSYRWIRDQLLRDIKPDQDAFRLMDEYAARVPAGSNGVLFNPSLGGGSAQEESPNIRGAFMGLSLSNTREDLIRATMEGIAMDLRLLLDEFGRHTKLSDEMMLCGGGSKSALWRQIFADVYHKKIIKTNIDQDAASLGAAAIAARCAGLWQDYGKIDGLHHIQSVETPGAENNARYERLLKHFKKSAAFLAELGDDMA